MSRVLDWLLPRVPDTGFTERLQPQIEAWVDRSVLEQVAVDFGLDADRFPLTRAAAMRVPAMARARNLTVGTIARQPLEALRADVALPDQPYWCYGSNGQLGDTTREQAIAWGLRPQAPLHRMTWTVDDLMFHGESLWLATSMLAGGTPGSFLHVPYDHWDVDADGRIVDLDAKAFPEDRVCWIPGQAEGLLTSGAETLRMAYDLERNARDVAVRPLRLEAHQTSAAELTAPERAAIVGEIRKAMAVNDGILFTNNAIELVEHRVDAEALQLGARNASALDVARHSNMPALMIDATAQGASLEYQTQTGRNQEWIDYGLSFYMDSVTARLSMDDVVPAGQRIAFNIADLTAPDSSDTGSPTPD